MIVFWFYDEAAFERLKLLATHQPTQRDAKWLPEFAIDYF